MKLISAILLLAGGTSAIQHRHHHKSHHHRHHPHNHQHIQTHLAAYQPNSQFRNVPNLDNIAPYHQRQGWPQGVIDNSVADDTILNWITPKGVAPPPIRYHDKMRQWVAGTWPFNAGGLDSYPRNAVDTGEDDNEVIDAQHKQDIRL